ncbi:aromatic ring-hydroxylating oxygenase subunit alpha [Aquibaculum arenosum]|uniref:Aromatic ring-hydroxylating dioxygenase subunit alpha n=1 Tax=Aquibaculum arenosum TaxID=3032591 RepID=A0ABT5YPD8_9PROT|nr:aromatic ring-hydroxylating dioxygenase subunit alpha [Fodinicurvata sp. CAU 1616]MDF2096830.1 aromatic ring-hydroxylating dioxygenase subunit alpha [Fodinicurvata sp. CAU 1616]
MTASLQRNLPAHFYVDPGVYVAERQAVFRRSWQLLGPESQVAAPGDYLAVELAGWHLFVLRGRDGVLRGFHNLCRHRGARLLAEGQGRCNLLRCPYHNWVYDQEGRLQKAPWFGEYPDFRLEDWPLEPVSVASWRGLLFLAIEPEQDLLEQLGDLPEEVADHPLESFTALATRRFVMAANWKTYTDNFVEGYHIPGIHPGFLRTIEFEGFETRVRQSMIRMTAPQKEGSFYGGKWMWMWPNWTLSTFPGGMNTSRINPLGPERTELVYHFYFADSSAEGTEARQRTIEGNCAIVEEDFGICEETQRNYASGAYSPGPLSPRHEPAVAYFQQRVQASLAPEERAAQ